MARSPRMTTHSVRRRSPPRAASPPDLRTVGRQRLWLASAFIFLMMGVVGWRLVNLQVTQAPLLQQRATLQQQTLVRPFLPRRSIVDRRSVQRQEAEYLAVDRPVYTLWAHPGLYGQETPATIASRLAPILELPEADLTQQLTSTQAVRVRRWLPESVADQVTQLRLDGLELVSERQRIYPQKELGAEVVGYVDLDHVGQAGVEYSWQTQLERTIQPVTVPRNGYGNLLAAEVPSQLLQTGETVLQLTLDMRLQRAARTALQEKVAQYQAERGSVLVMNPHTGEILAMASEPTYDPNRYYDGYDVGRFRNWAVTDLYEPGSTFKPLVAALALEAGVIEPSTSLYDEGRLTIGTWPVQNFDYRDRGALGWLTVTDIIARSSNVGMVHIMERLGRLNFYRGLEKLGLGRRSGVDLPFEVASRNKDQRQFTTFPIEAATASFGQGFALTPLQLLQMHGAIANGGQLVTPHVVRGLLEQDSDTLIWSPTRPAPEPVFSPRTTAQVRQMMHEAVLWGTGRNAAIAGYEVGGKTGTAQKPDPSGRGYLPRNQQITSFVGYYPALEPRYVLLAVVDAPQGDDAYGSTVAAPIVRAVIEEIITLEAAASAVDRPGPAGLVPTP